MPDNSVFVPGRLPPRGVEGLRRTFAALFRLLTRVEVHGLENLPAGGFIVSPNHLSRLDPPLVFVNLPQRRVTVFVADSYRKNLLFSSIVTMVDCIWVHRGATTPSTIKAAVRALQSGSILGVAPEGTRSLTHALQTGKTGAVYLAYASGAPIVPAAVSNTQNAFSSLLHLRRAKLTISFGEPLRFGGRGRNHRPTLQQLEDDTTELMCRLAALLPPEYRGVYADHPRTRELLAAKNAPAPAALPS